jgi:glycosyltransferase involved in cell wall biosynthesis
MAGSDNPRVLQLIAPAPFGGAESVAHALARHHGDVVTAALLQNGDPNHPFVEKLTNEGRTVVTISEGRRKYLREIDALARIIRQQGVSVVHTHVYHADLVGYFAARRTGVPIVATVHGLTGGDWKNRFYQWLDLRALKRFDAVICVSEPLRDKLIGLGIARDRVHHVPNPFAPAALLTPSEARARLGIPVDDRAVIGWVGRLSHEKGADLLLQAIAKLAQPRPRVVIVGEGPERETLQGMTRDLGLQDDIVFAGSHAGAGALLLAFDALVLSSRTEGLPMTLLESLGARVPVVAFAVGGIPNAVTDEHAWLAAPGNVGELAKQIESVLENRGEAATRSRAGERLTQTRFSASEWSGRIAGVYASAIRHHKKA